LQQIGTPEEVYLRPQNLFVAQFVGSPIMNVASARLKSSKAGVEVLLAGRGSGFVFSTKMLSHLKKNADVSLGIRPEGIHLAHQSGKGLIKVKTTNIEPLGSHDIVDVKLGDTRLRARTSSGFVQKEGQEVWVGIDPAQAHFFDNTNGLALRGTR
jgi:multiple sugar transport system ATP-binding protein